VTAKTVLTEAENDIKQRGAYNTPQMIAHFLVSWAIRNPSDSAIDISCGDGVFLEEAANRLLFLGGDLSNLAQVTGVEIDPETAKQASNRVFNRFKVTPKIINQGFFKKLPSLTSSSYEAVVGNPPFVRYRNFQEQERELAFDFMKEQGFEASKLTNTWVPFLVGAIHLLKPKGRLAMVMPAELFQVSYADKIREYLLNKFGFIFVVTFNQLVFPSVEQETILLMGIKGEGKGLRLIEIKNESELAQLPRSMIPQIPIQNSREKWTQYFLTDSQRIALRNTLQRNNIKKLGQLCSVDVGVVTGANDFFVLLNDKARELNAKKQMVPVVTRTKYLNGLSYTKTDWQNNASINEPSYLLSIDPRLEISQNLKRYLESGEREGWNNHFKCRMRKPWYVVPSIWVPDAFLFRQIGAFPRLTINQANATCTDTLHRVKFNDKKIGDAITVCFFNSLTFAFAEIFGRSYGGGVLELMPSEAEKLPMPLPDFDTKNLFAEVDNLLRHGLNSDALNLVDKQVLEEGLGFSKADIELIRSSWKDLSKRRKMRKKA
jgi:adenine-specific DNA-methyltransferase